MGDAYLAPIPHCPEHGKLHARADPQRYECVGFDGEGCEAAEGQPWAILAADLPWQCIGTVDSIDLGGGVGYGHE